MRHPVDVHVGKRIRRRRFMLGMTQEQLAEKVGVKFQQIQKYETGANRVSASRLWQIAEACNVSVDSFFEGLLGAEKKARTAYHDIFTDKEALALLRAYYKIPEVQRRKLFDLAKALYDSA